MADKIKFCNFWAGNCGCCPYNYRCDDKDFEDYRTKEKWIHSLELHMKLIQKTIDKIKTAETYSVPFEKSFCDYSIVNDEDF